MIIEFSTFTYFILALGYVGNVVYNSYTSNIPIDIKKEYINFGMFLSILFIFSLTLFPLDVNTVFNEFEIYNIIPFKVVFNLLTNYDAVESTYNILGNIVLFVPFGFFTYIKLNKNIKKTLACVLLVTLSIELTQAFIPARFCEIDDLILNTLGGYLGLKLSSFVYKHKSIY